MGTAGEREKIEDKMMLMKLERMEVQMEKEKELKKLSEIEGHTIKGQKIPDYIDPKFAKEKQIYDDDEENGVKKTDDARKKDKKSDKNKKDKKETKDKDKKKEKDKKDNKNKDKNNDKDKKDKKDKKEKKDKKSSKEKDDDKKKKKKK